MKECMEYWTELNSLMTDLYEAINNENQGLFGDVVETCRYVLSDIEESFQSSDCEENKE